MKLSARVIYAIMDEKKCVDVVVLIAISVQFGAVWCSVVAVLLQSWCKLGAGSCNLVQVWCKNFCDLI